MNGLGEGVIGERLLHLDGLVGVDESVHVGRHVGTEITAEVSDTVMLCAYVPW